MLSRIVDFASSWCWQPLACTGAIVTVAPNPSMKTSSTGLRQSSILLAWVDSSGGASSIVLMHLVFFFLYIFALCQCRTPFSLPALIIDGRPCLAIFSLPCHFCRDAIVALPLPCLCWFGTIIPLPLPCQHYQCTRTTTTTTAAATICLSPCHCYQRTSFASEASSLAVLANADASILIVSTQLQ